jgi:hypothetical protein
MSLRFEEKIPENCLVGNREKFYEENLKIYPHYLMKD